MLASLCDPAYAQELFVLRWCWRTGASFGKPSGQHVGLVQEDGRAGTEGRRSAAGGPETLGQNARKPRERHVLFTEDGLSLRTRAGDQPENF